MNRNIIFRGREPQLGVWCTGCLVANARGTLIVTLGGHSIEATEVDPDTVQQMTNCYHHGRDVWEGDVYADPAKPDERYTVYYDVVFDAFRIRWSDDKGTHSELMAQFLATYNHYKYVGNIIDLTDYSSNRPSRNS